MSNKVKAAAGNVSSKRSMKTKNTSGGQRILIKKRKDLLVALNFSSQQSQEWQYVYIFLKST